MTEDQINLAMERITGQRRDYGNDLNAMQRAMSILDNIQRARFVVMLDGICGPWRWDTINADARKRREAFLKALGKWKE